MLKYVCLPDESFKYQIRMTINITLLFVKNNQSLEILK